MWGQLWRCAPWIEDINLFSSHFPNKKQTYPYLMSAPVLSSSLTPNCLAAMQTPYTNMATACGQPSTPTLSNLLVDTAKLLPSACSKACSDALSAFSTAANTTCGEEV